MKLETYWRRAVYLTALERLKAIEKDIRGSETKMTGKAYEVITGVRVRGKGVMPSLSRIWPEVRGWMTGPSELLKVLSAKKKGPLYFELLKRAVHEVEVDEGRELERWVNSATEKELEALPVMMFPPHTGTASCIHCREPHDSDLHRFHLRGSRKRTHPKEGGKRGEEDNDTRERRRRMSEVPF